MESFLSLMESRQLFHLLKKKLGYAPVAAILAENDNLEYDHLYALNLGIGLMRSGVMSWMVVRCSI